MQSKVEPSKFSKPNPWDNVKYPCLLEHRDGSLAIAISKTLGYMIHNVDTSSPSKVLVDKEYGFSWDEKHWTPAVGPRTVTFSN